MARPYLPSFFGRGDDPFGSLFREVQKTLEDFSQRIPFAQFRSDMLSPKVDVAETKDAIEVTTELPGVDEKDLDVTLADGVLTVRGEKKTARDEQDKDKNWHVVERSYGSFSRAIPLPFGSMLPMMVTRLQSTNQLEMFSRLGGGMSPPVWSATFATGPYGNPAGAEVKNGRAPVA